MTGTWLGYYKYHHEEIQKAIGFDKTYFTIIIDSFAENKFKGSVMDDVKTGGMEGIGEITGETEGERVSFRKSMPRESLLYPDGEQEYSDKRHPTLYYTGTFSTDKTEINGVWKFKITVGLLFGFIPFPYRPGRGTWSMKLQ